MDLIVSPLLLELLPHAAPVLVCLLNVAWDILFPLSLDSLAAVQVELALHDLPDRWICLCDAPHRSPIGSVSTVLRGVFLWIGFEQIKMFGVGLHGVSLIIDA